MVVLLNCYIVQSLYCFNHLTMQQLSNGAIKKSGILTNKQTDP